VSGHGVEAALLSVSLLNRIQMQSPADPGLWDPAGMLAGFNRAFRSEDQNNLYFTGLVRFVESGNPGSSVLQRGKPARHTRDRKKAT
jgi:serine phosphatase RsbU (regulator of sigma subunit)